ncbi:energy transducer TonB [Chryseobacterium kwangjuense]|uniref:Energy transducer TonB n=1 Tax=Chryseobacterium kwangjuense TaxID=267125 RepID=A0A135W2K5_9FLAO|nr:hypothetical protein [Chryseobacterium kwangjuense]KXH79168.1 hypothetical protein AU378_21215 [Chryseobacterium kwangjuense]
MKHLNQNQEFRFNEVLFEHRNKEYGAYVLRNESDRLLTKALFVGISLLAAVSITPFVISAFETTETVVPNEPIYRPMDIIPNDPPKDKPVEIVKPVQPVAPPNVKQVDTSVPTPAADAIEPIKQDKPKDAAPGLIDNLKGEPVKPDSYLPPPPVIGNGPVIHNAPVPAVEKVDKNKIVSGGDLAVEAAYEGGINSFRNKVMNNFDSSGFEEDGIMKTTVTFVVEIDGTISGIKANGGTAEFNNEAVRTIKYIKGKWKPGLNKQGEAVRSYFKFPISMKFE